MAPVPEVLLACARELGLIDVVVLIDSALRLGRCTREEIESVARRRRRGAPLLRHALTLSDGRAESPWETLLRLLHWACDVPVEPQAVIRDASGAFVARADLLIVGTVTLQEYDGADHLERGQYGRDRRRDSRIAAAGHVRHGYVKDEVLAKPLVILRAADAALGRKHDPARVRAWHALLRESLFSEAGAAALMARWSPPPPEEEVAATA